MDPVFYSGTSSAPLVIKGPKVHAEHRSIPVTYQPFDHGLRTCLKSGNEIVLEVFFYIRKNLEKFDKTMLR